MKVAVFFLALLSVALAQYRGGQEQFHGRWLGYCQKDGLYVHDNVSLMVCSNGKSFRRPCAPGTQHKLPLHKYATGWVNYSDFCDEIVANKAYLQQVNNYKKDPQNYRF